MSALVLGQQHAEEVARKYAQDNPRVDPGDTIVVQDIFGRRWDVVVGVAFPLPPMFFFSGWSA